MKIPQLKKKPELKSCHNVTWEDDYSWIHQENILEVLKDSSKLLPEVRKYLEDENDYFSPEVYHFFEPQTPQITLGTPWKPRLTRCLQMPPRRLPI